MRIELASGLASRLRKALRAAGSREIGGILLAEQLAPGHFHVIDFSLDLYSGSDAYFQRDPAVHQRVMDAFFEKTDRDFSRFNYLGEWHSHPSFPVHPSQEDIDTMTNLVEHSRSEITFALLLIVRLRFWMWMDYSMTIFTRGYVPYEERVLCHRVAKQVRVDFLADLRDRSDFLDDLLQVSRPTVLDWRKRFETDGTESQPRH